MSDPRADYDYCPSRDEPPARRDYLERLYAMRERAGWESQNDRLEVEAMLEELAR